MMRNILSEYGFSLLELAMRLFRLRSLRTGVPDVGHSHRRIVAMLARAPRLRRAGARQSANPMPSRFHVEWCVTFHASSLERRFRRHI
ncbi:hypothetical protein Bcep1808_5249 [Burkholderia vietnamiensis G4]|uniref:Uncharacterized protein n=1 Tax=Burkholderia vietnamiensis (strain G4 / LMG 22486) TaxID=269482 RepID=A4JPJ5_BURVG|nr:hypothetical protein Bcep1808_5249 [Burkholderia vietnamiensis G4]